MSECIFCKIVSDDLPCHKIWEDEKHLAFLDICPSTKGASLVITKKHYTSNYLSVDDAVLKDLFIASKKVSLLLQKAFRSVSRVGLTIEGVDVDHLHYKLFPISKRADDKELAKLAQKIRDANINSNSKL